MLHRSIPATDWLMTTRNRFPPPRLLRLDDGSCIAIRPIRAGDRGLLRAAFEQSSPATRYRRFLYRKKELTDGELRYFSEVDGIDHVALVAVATTAAGVETGEPAGVARFIRVPGLPAVAEFAVVVIDARQRRGIGQALFRALMEAARERKIELLRGYLLADNDALRGLLDRCCAGTRTRSDGPLVIADCRLPGPGDWRPSPYPALRAADELWWLAAERALMLPLEHTHAASRLLDTGIGLVRVLAASPSGGGPAAAGEPCGARGA